MRHRKSFNHLGRTSSHRSAMLANMASSLILHKRINTTLAKAKALRMYVEPLITKAKDDTTHSRRVVFGYLQDKNAVTELFREVSGKIADRPGGYTRIIKLGTRLGDSADTAMIELVDYNENLLTEKSAKKAKSTRRRGGKKKADAATPKVDAPVEAKKEAKAEVEQKTAKVEELKAEAPKVEETKVEAPKAETPKVEAPKAEAPAEAKKEDTEKKKD